jgi:hypothetical protein
MVYVSAPNPVCVEGNVEFNGLPALSNGY